MSGAKVIPILRAPATLHGNINSLHPDMLNRLKNLHLCTALLNLQKTLSLLRYRPGDSALVQDIKVLLIHSLAYEAVSVSHPGLYNKFINLLDRFPAPPLMEGYLFQEKLRPYLSSGIINGFYKLAAPKLGDSPTVLRAKQAAHLRNYAKELALILSVDINLECPCPPFEKADYPFFFKFASETFEAHLSKMHPDLAELVKAHILDPETPFNVALK